ncbi:AAA family ATPase [Marinomonas gallaica]|uniref:AAA family ATPase n=1 Tax=Marinomonas gallaica TaxID=1806667 RepID=UPI000833B604|nr:AAA family ATPase [Marinomonas gallaica]
MRIAGDNSFTPIGRPATDKQFEIYGFEYLSGIITLDLTNAEVASSLREANYNDPMALFNRLYKLQQLGVKNWQYSSRVQLLKDNFYGTIKKPLKTRLPLSITELILSDGSGKSVCLDDLSDGEAQLIEILATAKIFSSKQTLFLFDEPETHLNPSWRTHFYSFVESAVGVSNEKSQLLISTHSPFMISSLEAK